MIRIVARQVCRNRGHDWRLFLVDSYSCWLWRNNDPTAPAKCYRCGAYRHEVEG